MPFYLLPHEIKRSSFPVRELVVSPSQLLLHPRFDTLVAAVMEQRARILEEREQRIFEGDLLSITHSLKGRMEEEELERRREAELPAKGSEEARLLDACLLPPFLPIF